MTTHLCERHEIVQNNVMFCLVRKLNMWLLTGSDYIRATWGKFNNCDKSKDYFNIQKATSI